MNEAGTLVIEDAPRFLKRDTMFSKVTLFFAGIPSEQYFIHNYGIINR